jgi:small-conductance mechanosensitive channel
MKDLVAGIIFRVSGKFREGEVIIHDSMKGTIKNFRIQSIEIETFDGKVIYIPYGKLIDSTTVKHESTDKSAAYSFTFLAPDELSAEEITDTIRQFLVSLPWSSSRKRPVATIREHASGKFTVEVTVYPIEKAFGKKIEQVTRDKFGIKL